VALWIGGHDARGWRELAALVAAGACVRPANVPGRSVRSSSDAQRPRPGGLPSSSRWGSRRSRTGASSACSAAGPFPAEALIRKLWAWPAWGVLLARAALVARMDEPRSQPGAGDCAGQGRPRSSASCARKQFGEYEVAGKLDPTVDLSEAADLRCGRGGEVIETAGTLLEQNGHRRERDGPGARARGAALLPADRGTGRRSGGRSRTDRGGEGGRAAPRGETPLAARGGATHPAARESTIAVTARTLSEAVRELRVDTVVIASDERPLAPADRGVHPAAPLRRHRAARAAIRGAGVAGGFRWCSCARATLAIGDGLNSPLPSAVKRLFDLVMSALLVVCTAPLLALLAVLIKLDSEGPVFYGQERVGRGGRIFRIRKLRTMRSDAERARAPSGPRTRTRG